MTRISLADYDEGRTQDFQTSEYFGCPEVLRHKDNAVRLVTMVWRRFQVFNGSIAFGSFKFGANIEYCKRVPEQIEMMS